VKNPVTPPLPADPQRHPTSATRRDGETQVVLALGRIVVTRARPHGVAPSHVEPPQAPTLVGAPAPEGHLPQEPPPDSTVPPSSSPS
jgi:hypothetical protein